METRDIIICTNHGNYRLDEKNMKWMLMQSFSNETKRITLRDISRLKADLFIQTGRDTVIVFDFAPQKKDL